MTNPRRPQRKPRPQSQPASPTGQVPRNARELAFVILTKGSLDRRLPTRLLDERLPLADFSDADRRLATELVHGIIRRRATLEALLQPHVSRPRHRIEDPLWTLLELGAYQLVFLDFVPPHAAVSETVAVAKSLGSPRWAGFLNAVLRSVARNMTDDRTDTPTTQAVPLTHGRFRWLQSAVFPNPNTDPAAYFAAAFSFPGWLAARWLPRFGPNELFRLGFWFNSPPGLSLRVNSLRVSRGGLLSELLAAGNNVRFGDHRQTLRFPHSLKVDRLPGFREGCFSVQDETAMQVSSLLAPSPGETVLDLCAAPGTKTTHLAELMRNTGRIVATDISPSRLKRVTENATRLGIRIIEPQTIKPDGSDIPAGPFDAILVDAPCSNTGVLGKRPEVRWRIRPVDIAELAAMQLRLLSAACDRLRPGGRVVYSTCSIEPEENEGVVAALIESRSDMTLCNQRLFLPGQPADGGFAALLQRRVPGRIAE